MSTNVSLVEGAYEAYQRGDIAAILDIIADDVDWHVVGPSSLPFPRECHTKEEVAGFFKALAESDDVIEFDCREIIDAGDDVVALGYIKTTLRATGESTESEWVHVMTVENGMLTRFVEFFDTASRGGH